MRQIMPTTNIYFTPFNSCIYCGVLPFKKDPLTKEHIIPEALNGNFIFPFSSCKACAKSTGAIIEQQILGNFLKYPRVIGEMKSKRKIPETVKIEILVNEKYVQREVPRIVASGVLGLPRFSEPGILSNRLIKNLELSGFDSLIIKNQPSSFYIQNNIHGFKQKLRLKPSYYMQMLAKIGFGFYVAEKRKLPPDNAVLIRDLIFGREKNLSTYIGSTDSLSCEKKCDSPHNYKIIDHIEGNKIIGSGVLIHLFSNFKEILNTENCKYYVHIWGSANKNTHSS